MSPRAPRRMESPTFTPCVPFTWVPWCVPSENQNGPSCAGHAIANFKEIMLRRFVGMDTLKTFKQIDGDAIWAQARLMFYSGNMNGGLYISEAFEAAMYMGIFAPGSRLARIPRDAAMYAPQFEYTPFIDGRDVSGWVNHGTSPDNGQIYEGPGSDGTAGHATIDVSRLTKGDFNYWQDQNSWSPKFGWNGLFILSEKYDDLTGLDEVKYYIQEPAGWEQWNGWIKHVI